MKSIRTRIDLVTLDKRNGTDLILAQPFGFAIARIRP